MRAVDCESFAGGFTLGVAQAGFDVVGKRELPGGFGVPSVRANEHLVNAAGLEIQVGPSGEWTPVDDLDLVFGNPPCSAFSGVSDKKFAGADNAINSCMWELVEYAARCNGGEGPPVVVYESVQNAYARGRDLLRALHARLCELTGAPYQLHHVLHNAYNLGGCAQRRRYFWVSTRIPLGYAYAPLENRPTLWEAISDLFDLDVTLEPQPYGPEYGANPSWWARPLQAADGKVDGHLSFPPQYHRQSQALLDGGYWEMGESLTKALRRFYETYGRFPTMENERDEKFAAHYGPGGRDFDFGGAWQPERWRYDRPARVITGGSSARSIHPFAARPLTLREMYRIQGFPDDWRLKPAVEQASANTATLWPGKGIPVQSGQWIATMVRDALDGNPHADGPPLEQVGDGEYVWNGSSVPRPTAAARPRKTTTKTTTEEKRLVPETATDGYVQQIMEMFRTGQAATVSLAGLDPKAAKKQRELLYTAAYKLGGKVRVRSDRTAETATGTFYVPETVEVVPDPQQPPVEEAATTEHVEGQMYVDGQLHVAADGSRWRFNLAANAWDPAPAEEPAPVPEPETVAVADPETVAVTETPTLVDSSALLSPEGEALLAETKAHVAELKQPKNSARAVKDRRFDLTQLRAGSHGYYVHRDYAAHYFRWGWAARQLRQGDTLLEVGCGQDLPLTRVLIYYPGAEMPKAMVCVDLNKIKDHVQPQWLTVYDETNFIDQQGAIVERHGKFNVVTCFEVIEHMPKPDGVDLLVALRDSVADDGFVLLSTPVFNGRAAANHIHEWTIPELEEAIVEAGLVVDKRWGTFASYADVKHGLTEWLANYGRDRDVPADAALVAQNVVTDFYEQLREFYSDDVLANFMAPNLPDHARNNVWRLRKAPPVAQQTFIQRVGASKFKWTCPVCKFTFERTDEPVLVGFASGHLGSCDGTPPGPVPGPVIAPPA